MFKMTSITFLLLSLSTLLSFVASNSSFPPPKDDDGVSLLAFKSKADLDDKLRYSVVVNESTSGFCQWQGVQCRIVDGKVTRLVLENLNLTGVFAENTLTRLDQLRVLSLRNNSLSGHIPDLARLVNLKALFLDRNRFTGGIPRSVAALHRLRTLDLSCNELSGAIPVGLSGLDRLNYLRLDSNRLNGSIPPLNQSSLQIFNVSVNLLTGPVPVTPTLSRFGPAVFSVNGRLCGKIVKIECGPRGPFFGENSTSDDQSSSPNYKSTGTEVQKGTSGVTNSTKRKRVGLILGFSAGLLLLIISVLCVIMLIKAFNKNDKKRKSVVSKREMMEMAEAADAAAEVMRMEDANELEKKVRKLHQGIALKKSGSLVFYTGESRPYTVEQLMRASAELLGSGSVGTTYKAVLDNGVIVCVKRLDASRLGGMTNEEFERHMEVVGKVRHPNVVAIGAYFQAKEEKLIVSDYQPNGSLFSLIHGSKSTRAKPLHWTSCLKIAEDVAQGAAYLHQTCNLVHGNLKSSNVLLGSDFEARISDYCLSALFHHNAPETQTYNEPTAESDVFSFGVLLFELLTGKASYDHPELSPDDVVKWVKSSRDGNGGGGMAEKPLEMITEVAIACCVRSPEMRPTMWQVITMLQEIKEAAIMEDCGIGSS